MTSSRGPGGGTFPTTPDAQSAHGRASEHVVQSSAHPSIAPPIAEEPRPPQPTLADALPMHDAQTVETTHVGDLPREAHTVRAGDNVRSRPSQFASSHIAHPASPVHAQHKTPLMASPHAPHADLPAHVVPSLPPSSPPSPPPSPSAPALGGRGWPFVPLAPLIVVLVGVAVALGIGLVGLDHLARAGDTRAGARAQLLAATVAARLSQLPAARHREATQLAARRTAAELLLVTENGRIVHDFTLGAPDEASIRRILAAREGVARMRLGRTRFAVHPIGDEPNAARLVVFVAEPTAAHGSRGLVSALAALTVMLLGVAAAAAYAVSNHVTHDVDFVTQRVLGMAQVRTEPTGELVPPRTMDEVGLLTTAFNKLVARFGLAEKAYRENLARASAADRDRAAFLAAVSHELRSPLNAILGFADILMEEVDGPLSPSAREEVEQIRGSGAHLAALINDILELSALESGQLKLSRAVVDLVNLASEVVREARGLVGAKDLVIRVEGDPALVARVDGRRVRQILGNLVNNAVKFTHRGEVVVRVMRQGAFASLSVSDTGPGISQQERAVIFNEYKQARSERAQRRGTGLGLAIARRLVLLHHGAIHVESALGRGSTFKVLLPIGNVEPSAKAPQEHTVVMASRPIPGRR